MNKYLVEKTTVYTLQPSGKFMGKGKDYHEMQENKFFFQVMGKATEAELIKEATAIANALNNYDNLLEVARAILKAEEMQKGLRGGWVMSVISQAIDKARAVINK